MILKSAPWRCFLSRLSFKAQTKAWKAAPQNPKGRSIMPFSRQIAINRNLKIRARTVQAVRVFFIKKGYIEIETPCRIPAPAPEEHIDAQTSGSWYLQTSPELCMKRLLAAGYPRIFQICKCFRQNERGSKHLPELTMLEWYTLETDYFDMMAQTEDLIGDVVENINSNRYLVHQGNKINLKKPWSRISVAEAFEKYTSTTLENALSKDLFDELLTAEIEPNLGLKTPVFLYDYPASFAPLAMTKPGNPCLAQRFELYIAGLELCNAYTELTDPDEQRERFEIEQKKRHSLGKRIYPMPETFLESLEFIPGASGNALGIDRLIMLLADTANIDDVVAFTPEEL